MPPSIPYQYENNTSAAVQSSSNPNETSSIIHVSPKASRNDALDSLPWVLPSDSNSDCAPICRLRLYGFCCPFLETEEEQDARTAAYNLQSYPIVWYRKKLWKDAAEDVKGAVHNVDHNGKVTKGVNGLIDGIVRNADKLLNGSTGGHDEMPLVYVGYSAILSIVDNADHGPSIEVKVNPGGVCKKGEEQRTVGSANPSSSSSLPSKIIPLSLIESVSPGWSLLNNPTEGGVKVFGNSSTKKSFLGGSGQELLRFDTLGGGGNAFHPNKVGVRPNEFSEEVITQLRALVKWNKRRMATLPTKKAKPSYSQVQSMAL